MIELEITQKLREVVKFHETELDGRVTLTADFIFCVQRELESLHAADERYVEAMKDSILFQIAREMRELSGVDDEK